MVVGLGIAMIDECEPKFERVDFRPPPSALKQFLKRSCEWPGTLAIAVNVDSITKRQFYTGGRLKGLKARPLKSFGQAFLAVRTGNIGNPFIVGKKAQRL